MGENPKVVSERLGHARVGITLDIYSHTMRKCRSGQRIGLVNILDLTEIMETAEPMERRGSCSVVCSFCAVFGQCINIQEKSDI
ncbi:hypothetical protein [Bacillus sp. D12]|nr:hypothetical protein [Bacillus sp. D12]